MQTEVLSMGGVGMWSQCRVTTQCVAPVIYFFTTQTMRLRVRGRVNGEWPRYARVGSFGSVI